MGKAALLAVAATILGVTYFMVSEERAAQQTGDVQNTYQYNSIARDVANSGFERVLGEVKRDLTISEGEEVQGQMDGGYYEGKVLSHEPYGDLTLTASGESNGSRFNVDADVIYEAPFDAAIGFDVDSVSVTASGAGYTISGRDERSYEANQRGYLPARHAIHHVRGAARDFNFSGDARRLEGRGEGSTRGSRTESNGMSYDYEDLFVSARDEIGWSREVTPSGGLLSSNDASYLNGAGTRNNPAYVYVNGDIETWQPVQGHGLLVVDGNLDVSSLDWNGLVLVRKKRGEDASITLHDDSQVRGSLVAYEYGPVPSGEEDEGAPPDEGCYIEIDTDNHDGTRVDVPHRIENIEVIGSALEVSGYDMPVTVQLEIDGQTYEPWGDYSDAMDGNVNRAGTFVFSTGEREFPPGAQIRVNARSWKRTGTRYEYRTITRRVCTGFTWGGRCYWGSWRQEEVQERVPVGYNWGIHAERSSGHSTNSDLEVLKNDSQAPDKPGYNNQDAAEEFVREYIGTDGKINLDGNQSINLFELWGSDQRANYHDLQDLIVVATMSPVEQKDWVCPTADGDDDDEGGHYAPAMGSLDMAVKHQATVQYSPEALAKLGRDMDLVRERTEVVITRQKETLGDS